MDRPTALSRGRERSAPHRTTPSLSYRLDVDGVIVWASDDISRELGWAVDELVGMTATDLIHPDDLARGILTRRAIYDSATNGTGVLRTRRKDGSYAWLSLDARADTAPDGSVVGTTVAARALQDADEATSVLAEAEWHFRMLALNTFDVVVHEVEGRIAWVSPSVVTLLGYPADELGGRPTVDLCHPDDLAGVVALQEAAVAGSRREGLVRLRHRDGHHVWLDIAASPDGGLARTGMVVSLRDATARLAEEAERRTREAEYRMLAENAVDLVVRSDLDGNVAWVSPSCERMLGYPPEELIGRSFAELIHPDDLADREGTRAELADGHAAEFLARYRHKEGHFLWLGVAGGPATDESGAIVGLVATARDATAEVEARQALEASEEMFRRVMAVSSIGMAVADLDGRFLAVNSALCHIVDRDEAWLLARTFADIVHPAHLQVSRTVLASLRSGSDDVDTRVLRMLRRDGDESWVRRTAVLVRNEDGTPKYVVAQFEDLSAERAAKDQLAYQAFHDPLTGLRNRAWVIAMLENELRSDIRPGSGIGVLFLDLDNMKVVNDSLGHDAGDQVIGEMGRRIGSVLSPGNHLGRFGGDEFVVVVPRTEDPLVLERLAAQLLESIAEPIEVDGHRVVPSASIGIVLSRGEATAASLLRDADSALSRAKSSGRASWHFFDERMHSDAIARLTVEDELRRALAEHQLVVHYQPIVTLPGRRVVGHEALVRWQHPTRGLVPPLDFLPVAEESGLIVDVDHEVLDQVCALLAARPDLPGPISVNKSPLQIARRGWRSRFLEVLTQHGVDPRRLVVEVTETAALDLNERAREDLEAVRALGVGIHVDDFGTGYSSISLLRDLPVTGLKLDGSFTHRLTGRDDPADALAAGLAGLARGLHLTSIAEGVETEEQAETLAAQGWTHGQGWLFGRPQPEPFVG